MSGVFTCEALIKRGDERFAKNANWLNLCQAIAEIFYPERADFVTQTTEGAERYQGIFSGEPILLRERLGSGIGVLTRRADQHWFQGKVLPRQIGEIDHVKRWAESFTETLRDEIYSPLAMFDRAMREGDHDYVAFGEHILWRGWGEHGHRGRRLYKTLHLRDCAYFINEFGVIDEMHEKICDKPLEQWQRLVAKAGGTLPEAWAKKLRENPRAGAETVEVRRVVLPAARYSENGKIKGKSRDMAFASVYIACGEGEKQEILCDGFRQFPYWVRRWSTVSGETRARSPCTGVAMADSRILNVAQRSLLESLEKAVDPPILLPHDGIIGDVEIYAGGRIMYDTERGSKARDVVDTLTPGDVRLGIEFVQGRQIFLTQAMYGDLLKRLPNKEMTAFEADIWLDDYVTMAAPVLLPMRTDNALLMEGEFQALMHARRLPTPPQEVLGNEVSFEFDDPLASAERRKKAQRGGQLVTSIGEMRAIGQQNAGENVNWDKLERDVVEGIADNMDWLLPEADVQASREARAAEQAAKLVAAAAMQEQQRQDQLAGASTGGGTADKAMEKMGLPTPNTAPQDILNAGA